MNGTLESQDNTVSSDDHVMVLVNDTPFGLVYTGCRSLE